MELDAELLEAAYRVFSGRGRHQRGKRVQRLMIAVRWLSKAWRNAPSIRPDDRVVFLKTAFEALTGTSQSLTAARRLRDMFERLRAMGVESHDVQHLLWSPAEQPRHALVRWDRRTGDETIEHLTDLEHWFMGLSTARNTIVHNGS